MVPASRSECIADLKGDKIARTGSGYREAVPRPHHVGVGDRVRPVPDEVDKASGEVRHSIPVRVHPDFRRRDIRGLIVSEVEVVIEIDTDRVIYAGYGGIRDEQGDVFAVVAHPQRVVRVKPEMEDPARARDPRDVVVMTVEGKGEVPGDGIRRRREARVHVPGTRRGRERESGEQVGSHRIRIEGHGPIEVGRGRVRVPRERPLEVGMAEVRPAVHR